MPDRVNQHFVPQYYFRHFSETDRTIGALLLRDGKSIPYAPIKGQCARNNFYGSKELESIFSQLESMHCHSIRAAIEIAWHSQAEFFSVQELTGLFEAIVFQRGRTALEIEKQVPAMQGQRLHMFKHYLKHKEGIENRDELICHLESSKVTISEPPQATIGRSVSTALEAAPLIMDMRLLLLRNRTDYPFIFSDAPVVFYNNFCRQVKNRGVLGMQCQGLQIFYPLDSHTCLLLMDREKYTGPFEGCVQYDLERRSDVSQINAMQLHHSLNSVYYGSRRNEDYISDLWRSHRATIKTPTSECRTNVDFLVDGRRPDGEIMHVMEHQINFELNLSFIDCDPVAEHEYIFAPRSKDLYDEHKQKMYAKLGK